MCPLSTSLSQELTMGADNKDAASRLTATDRLRRAQSSRQHPFFATAIAILLVVAAIAAIVGGILLSSPAEGGALSSLQTRLGVRSEEGG